MSKLMDLVVEGTTISDLLDATMDGFELIGDFSLTNNAKVKLENLRVKYLLGGVKLNTVLCDASKTVVIRQQRPARELSEAELTRTFSRTDPLVRHYSEAGHAIETPEQLAEKRKAAIGSMTPEEKQAMIDELNASME